MKKLCLIISIIVMFNTNVFDIANAEVHSYQLSLVNPMQLVNERHSIKGIRINLMYGINDNISGFDCCAFNIVEGEMKGFQFGLYNYSFKTTGLQIGIINRTEYLNGIQIGLINIHVEASGFRQYLPVINFSF